MNVGKDRLYLRCVGVCVWLVCKLHGLALVKLRTHLSENILHGKPGDIRNPSWLHAFTSRVGLSTATDHFADKGNYPDRVYAPYCVYKGKASLTVYPSGGLKVDRHGVMMLQFSPAVGERKYDWEKKQFFALSAVEVGSLLSLSPGGGCEFFHDPSMKTRTILPYPSNAGQVRKSLSVKSMDGGSYFLSLSVVNNIQKTNERLAVPLTAAEFAVMQTACSV
ncbi:Single-stranded DNA-binding protein WHY2, mitochondrial [Vitis vinifera]|uniref:Single-stranded DNA-binding protein WHY2, mitochondrial n=1 Tax=Vitis vinifera TaxID=29760 RepID=A0A438HGJ5_VITVI|nr:Single-stranded DNA-binding protein WHY2, mitochondrial [Vitis vinifera]